MTFRLYNAEQDRKAALRVWREVGWLEKGEEKEKAAALFLECGRTLVAEANGAPECVVNTMPATMRYLDEDLPFSAVTSVTTSRVARKQGRASRLTARAVALDAADGALVAGLGVFEQGFYNQLGFGSGGYEYWIAFDPARLRRCAKHRVPQRITVDDWARVHAARLARLGGHGAVSIIPAGYTQSEMMVSTNGFGLGYCDGPNDEITHHIWCRARGVDYGPYTVEWMSYQTWEQFLELMTLLHSLGDQVRLIRMREPRSVQLQDLVKQPFQRRQVSERGKFATGMRATAYWQERICDLPGCLEHTHLRGGEVRFNLVLSDPVERFLDDDAPWHGVGGEYVVTLGSASGAVLGTDASLPTLRASVGALTRMWLGVRPASGLAVTDELAGPPELLEALDWTLLLPEPKPDWDY